MRTKELHVKKIENPDFSDLSYKGKNLVMGDCYSKYSKFPGRVYIGEVKQFDCGERDLFLDGFGMINSTGEHSGLEKQTILGGKYFGCDPFYGTPLTGLQIKEEGYTFYEFKDSINIDELRHIVSGKEKRLIITEDK